MEGIVLFIHIVVCVLLVVVVLLQSGKSADLAGAFGGMGSQSTFGPRGGASFLSKLTTTLAILFMVTSLTLWIIASNKASGHSVIAPGEVTQEETTTQDQATPAAGEQAGETVKPDDVKPEDVNKTDEVKPEEAKTTETGSETGSGETEEG